MAEALRDRFGRRIDYLRVSVIDTCNLRCVYCMPLRGLQFVPEGELLMAAEIERVGRAAEGMANDVPDDETLARAWLIAAAIESVHPNLAVQYDVFDREVVLERPEIVYAADGDEVPGILVVEEDGTVSPVTYGMSRAFSVCNLKERGLGEAWAEFESTRYREFRAFCRGLWDELAAAEQALPFFDWHELVTRRSRTG